jgi:hypothetical protein
MTVSQGKKLVSRLVLAVAVSADGAGVMGCGNPGEGTVKVDPKVRARFGKGPNFPTRAVGKTTPQPPGIKSRLRTQSRVK